MKDPIHQKKVKLLARWIACLRYGTTNPPERLAQIILEQLDTIEVAEMLKSVERDSQSHLGENYAD